MEIKLLTNPSDTEIEEIIQIHMKVLTESFLNNFGNKFLEIIYKNLSKSKNTIILIVKNEKIDGFALATKNYSDFFADALAKKIIGVMLEVLKGIIKKPTITPKLLRSVPEMLFKKNEPHAELQFIAISPNLQGRGFGTLILNKLDEEFSKIGVNSYLVGTKEDNTLSNNFYKKNGFIFSHTKKFFGDTLNYYDSPSKLFRQ